MHAGLQAVAHESSDDLDPMHCPWCGSGQITGLSDGSIECGYCQRVFTVRLQPAFPGMPQSIGGEPFPLGQPGAFPGAPGDEVPGQPPAGMVEEDTEAPSKPASDKSKGKTKEDKAKDKVKDSAPADKSKKKSVLRTATGDELEIDQYIRHLAIVDSGYDETVLAQVREDSAQ